MQTFALKFLLGLSLGITIAFAGVTGCRQDTVTAASNNSPDPAAVNMAPVNNAHPAPLAQPVAFSSQPTQVAQQTAPPPPDQYNPPPPPPPAGQNMANPDNGAYQDAQAYEQLDEEGQAPPAEYADQPPPQLPEYDQPIAPAPNYIWTPGYWYWAPAGYYWIPGAWCAPPYYGALWTPGYWRWYHNRWGFFPGYWGPYIGFYGGINYGFGYTGYGYDGGYWRGNSFYYNSAVNRINVNITHVYTRNVVVNNNTRVSYNGGRGGIAVRPQPAELAAMRGPRVPPMTTQLQSQRDASQNRAQFYNVNRGRPAIVAAPRPIAAQPGIARPNTIIRPTEPNSHPQTQPARPDTRPTQTQNQYRPTQSQPQYHPTPQPQYRPDPQPQSQTQYRPAPQPQPRPQPSPQPRPQPQSRPAPQSQPRPEPHPQNSEGKPRR
jgi:hypothetical protein